MCQDMEICLRNITLKTWVKYIFSVDLSRRQFDSVGWGVYSQALHITHSILTWLSCITHIFISELHHVKPSDHLPCLVGQLKSQKSLKSLESLKDQWPGCHIPLTFHIGILTEVTGTSHETISAGCVPKQFISSTTGYGFGDGHEFPLLPTISTYPINSLSSLLTLGAEFGCSLEVAFLLEKIPPIWYEILFLRKLELTLIFESYRHFIQEELDKDDRIWWQGVFFLYGMRRAWIKTKSKLIHTDLYNNLNRTLEG